MEDSGRDLWVTTMAQSYLIVIRGSTLASATEEALHFAYLFLSRALQQHRQEGKNGEYEVFALEVLGLLQKYKYLYTTLADAPEPPFKPESMP